MVPDVEVEVEVNAELMNDEGEGFFTPEEEAAISEFLEQPDGIELVREPHQGISRNSLNLQTCPKKKQNQTSQPVLTSKRRAAKDPPTGKNIQSKRRKTEAPNEENPPRRGAHTTGPSLSRIFQSLGVDEGRRKKCSGSTMWKGCF